MSIVNPSGLTAKSLQEAATSPTSWALVHRHSMPGIGHLDDASCYCEPLFLSAKQIHAYSTADLQQVLDGHFAVQ